MMRNWWRRYKVQRAMRVFRREMALLGCPVSHLTDEQIRERIETAAQISHEAGMTMEECGRRLSLLMSGR